MKKKLLVIDCKISGSGEGVAQTIENALVNSDVSYTIKSVSDPPELVRLLKKMSSDYEAVAVSGGDGSINSAIKALAGTNIKLIIIPGGTGNVIATNLGVPESPTALINDYQANLYETMQYDVASVGKDMLALDMYVGWWAKATSQTPRQQKQRWGQLAYGISALKSFSVGEKKAYQFMIDGRTIRTKAYTAIIANRGAQTFLGLKLFPQKHRSGVLKIAVIKSVSLVRFIIWLVGRSIGLGNVGGLIKTYKGHEITIQKAPKQLLYDDYETKLKLPTTIKGGEAEVTIVVPKGGKKRPLTTRIMMPITILAVRLGERIRNYISGKPKYKYSRLMPKLYIGGAYRDSSYEQFRHWGVTGIVSMRNSVPKVPPKGFEILHLKTKDLNAPTLEALEEGTKFIQSRVKKGEGVYIHCRQGEGRGPTMAAAYLISQGLSVDQAIKAIKKARPVAHPNKKQIEALTQWSLRFS